MTKPNINIDDVRAFLFSNDLLCLVGENMSGKSTILKELRKAPEDLANNSNVFAIHIDTPLNSMHLTSNSYKGEVDIRLDNISVFMHKVFSYYEIQDEEVYYDTIIKNVNEAIQVFDDKVELSIQDYDLSKTDVRRHLDIILKNNLQLNDVNEIADKEAIENWRAETESTVIDIIKKHNFSIKETKSNMSKRLLIKYAERQNQKLTKVSSGLESLLLLIFVHEAISLFNSQIEKLEFWVFLDEPECYLHPTWQKELLNYLAAKSDRRLKVVYATHSQHLIPISSMESIGIVKNVENNINFNTLKSFIQELEIDNKIENEHEINIVKPVEAALGIDLNTFSHPFVTVEGEEELDILRKRAETLSFNKIINLKGADNMLPFVQAAKLYNENFKGVFLLDADLEVSRFINSMRQKKDIVPDIKHYFIFVGKKLYSFDEMYKTEIEDKKTRYVKQKHECLEDYIATNMFESPQKGYEKIKELAKKTVNEFKNDTNKNIEIQTGFDNCINDFDETKDFYVIADSCFRLVKHIKLDDTTAEIEYKRNEDLRKQMKDRLKTLINDVTKELPSEKFDDLLSRIKSVIA